MAYGNLIETASGIFNNILSDDDGKFTVGLDYVQGDRTPNLQTSGRFGFTVSTQISKSILINGKVGVPVGGISESVVVGDVEVDFYSMKMARYGQRFSTVRMTFSSLASAKAIPKVLVSIIQLILIRLRNYSVKF